MGDLHLAAMASGAALIVSLAGWILLKLPC
jgi:hypothetical protein